MTNNPRPKPPEPRQVNDGLPRWSQLDIIGKTIVAFSICALIISGILTADALLF